MKKISVENVRVALLEQGFVTERELSAVSDEELRTKSFKYDLGMDSLDCLVFVENLEGGGDLSSIDLQILDDDTVGDFIDRYL